MTTHNCDIAIIGGGLGGCAAALAACQAGKQVILTEENAWIGGQITAQGVSALDEHEHIETFGGTATYYQLREAIRQYYPGSPRNPGNGWVSRLCFEPRAGLAALEQLLQPYIDRGQLRILRGCKPTAATITAETVQSVTVSGPDGDHDISAACFLDATELGDLLPLTGTPYVIGAEADTGEDAAPSVPIPSEMQSLTWCFAVEFCPGEDHTIDKPTDYETFRDTQPYSLTLTGADGASRRFYFFGGDLPFWTYRRMRDGAQLGGNDVALINWHGNDYFRRNILDASPEEAAHALDEARRLSLGFLYWLQTECPRDDGGTGYPELKLRPDIMGTADGLAQYPYIRESRRIVPLKRVHAYDITADHQRQARAANHRDSVGIGWYAMDLHPCVGQRQTHIFSETRPFQIPLGSLIPQQTRNLLAACKNVGTTHLSNGAYRLQPVEWNIGEAAGWTAAYCLDHNLTPAQVWQDDFARLRLQYRLAQAGIPLAWMLTADNVPALHVLLAQGLLADHSAAANTLTIDLDAIIAADTLHLEALACLNALLGGAPDLPHPLTWRELARVYAARFDEVLGQ